jgi:hypothetical protein
MEGASGAVAEPVAWASWGKPVLRLAVLSAGRKSGAGAGGFYATGEHISAVESMPARSGVSEVWLRRRQTKKQTLELPAKT